MKRLLHGWLSLIIGCVLTASLAAQGSRPVIWAMQRYDLQVTLNPETRVLRGVAKITAQNIGGTGSTLTTRLNAQAQVKSVTIDGANATFRASPERQAELQKIETRLNAPVAGGQNVTLQIEYELPVAANSGLAAVSGEGAQFLPLGSWYPTPNALISPRGADYAPTTITVNGLGVDETLIAAGQAKGQTATTDLAVQPFFLTGARDIVGEANGESAVYLTRGARETERQSAARFNALAIAARQYFANLLGNVPAAPLKIVSVNRGAGFSSGGVLLLDRAAFRRTQTDAETALRIAETVARLWIGGSSVVTGDGAGVIREGLTRHLAIGFLDKQFGARAADAELLRGRSVIANIAKRDAPLAQLSPADDIYFGAVNFKGASVWRLIERTMGREAFIGVLKTQLQATRGDINGLTLAALRAALSAQGGATVTVLLSDGLDTPTETNLQIGLPQVRSGQSVAAVRNTSALAVRVPVAAITDKGERLIVEVNIPAKDFGEAVFANPAKIVSVEIDPDKLYPQIDYTDDIAPRAKTPEESLGEGLGLFARGEFAKAETAAREMLARAAYFQEARILLARALLKQNRAADAEKEFRAALAEPLPTALTQAWANVGLGEIAAGRGQQTEAARYFALAAAAQGDYASQLTARQNLIKTEAVAASAPVADEAIKKYIVALDTAIKAGSKTGIEQLITGGELGNFVKGIVGAQPEIWQTNVVRTEMLDANHAVADVTLTTRSLGRDQSGTAVYYLTRSNGGWKLAAIDLFEVN